MKKFIIIIASLILTVGLCSCGENSDPSETSEATESAEKSAPSGTFEYLSYDVPDGYEQSEGPSVPLYSNSKGDTVYIVIEQAESDDVTVEDMLAERMKSNEYADVTIADDVTVDGITAKQFYSLDIESNTMTLCVAFVNNDDLVTISMWTVHDKIPDDAMEVFTGFIESIKINK